MLGKSSPTRPRRGNSSGGGMPAWLVFLLGVALVFGVYYLWLGVRDYTNSIGLSGIATREASTQTAIAQGALASSGNTTNTTRSSSTSPTLTGNTNPVEPQSVEPTPAITLTPIPECMDFVIVERTNVRNAPNTNAGVVEVYQAGQIVCVLGLADEDSDWYLIDFNPLSRRVDAAYIYHTLVRAVNPTPRPTHTNTPLPTVTPFPTLTPSITPTPRPTLTPDLDATETPTPTPTTTPTVSYQSA